MGEINSENVWACSLLCEKLSNWKFNFYNRFRTAYSCYICVFEWVFKAISPFPLSPQVYWHSLFIMFPYYSFTICRICSANVCLISDIGYFFFPFLYQHSQSFINFADYLKKKNTAFRIIVFLYWFSLSSFIDFCFLLWT